MSGVPRLYVETGKGPEQARSCAAELCRCAVRLFLREPHGAAAQSRAHPRAIQRGVRDRFSRDKWILEDSGIYRSHDGATISHRESRAPVYWSCWCRKNISGLRNAAYADIGWA